MARTCLTTIAIGGVLAAPVLCARAAPDEPARPAAVAVRFRPAAGERYAADYEEHVKVESAIGRKPPDVQKVDSRWKLEFTARAARKDLAIPLDASIVSLSGDYVGAKGDRNAFDSATGKCTGENPWPNLVRDVLATVGKKGGVVVSAAGEVIEVADAFLGLTDAEGKAPRRKQETAAFFERFFAPLPAGPVKEGASWSAPRWIAPHLVVATEHLCGAVDERFKLAKIGDGALSISIAGSGTAASAARKLEPTALPSKLTNWSSAGTVELDPVNGVPLSKSSRIEVRREEYFKEFDTTIRYVYSIETKLAMRRIAETPSSK